MADETRRSFKRGAEASEEASKSGGLFDKTFYWSIENGQQCFLRFITDAPLWIAVDQHQNVPTKAKPSNYPQDRKWPEKMSAVCRNTKMEDEQPMYGDCYICEFMVGKVSGLKAASGRTWALACEREEVIGDGTDAMGGPNMKGRRIGFKDKTREVQVIKRDEAGNEIKGSDGKYETETVVKKAIVVVNQGFKNFFSVLKGSYGYFGTVLDRDFVIKREGSSTDTTYSIINLDPVPVAGGGNLDLRNPEHMTRYGFANESEAYDALAEIVADHASAERFARFFDPRVTADDDGNITQTGQAPAPPKPSNDESADRLAALRDRVTGYAPPDGQPAAPAAAAPAQEAAPPAPDPAPAPAPAPAAEATPPAPAPQAPAPAPAPAGVAAGAMQDFG